MTDEQPPAARKIYASPRAARLAEAMSDRRGELSGLWSEKIRAVLFLASYAAFKGLAPVPINAKEEIGNLYTVQKGAGDVGELAVFHLLYGGDGTLDATLRTILPDLVEAGAIALEETLLGPDPVGGLVGLLGGESPLNGG